LNRYHIVLVRYLRYLLQTRSNSPSPQVRGTPASGKSTLAQLLANHIASQEPTANPVLIANWPKDGSYWNDKLTKQGFNNNGPKIIIIDEAQLTYWDGAFWNSFLKQITPTSNRVILFASYGSPTGTVTAEGTPMIIPDRYRIELRPIDHGDGVTPAGLFLTTDEFADVVGKKYPTERFEQDFLDYVLRVTAGHVGAVTDLLEIVYGHDVSSTSNYSIH
jgi:hypothetical protein